MFYAVCESSRFGLEKDSTMGCGHLVRLSDNLSTPLFVYSEGEEDMQRLEMLCTNYPAHMFDSECEEYFTEGSTVYDREGERGFLRQGQFVKLED